MTIKDQQVVLIHPSSILSHKPNFVLFNEFAITKKNYMRTCTRVDPQWLIRTNPAYFEQIRLNETRAELDKAADKTEKANSMANVIRSMILWKDNGVNRYFEVDFTKQKY